MFNGYGEENTIISIEKDTADRYYIETKIERTDSSFGRIYIATGRDEAKEVLKEMEHFLDHPMVEYTMLGIKDDYLKLFREAEEDYSKKFVLKDCIGREWQCGTLQVDFNLPERFDIYYTDNEGQKHHPVMLHRAILGSIERFIGILIENYNGNFPFWLAPCQIAIVTVSQKFDQYANDVYKLLNQAGFRVQLDDSAETLMYKVRKYSKLKIPKIIVLGQKEMDEKSIGIRSIGSNITETILLDKAIEYFNNLQCA